MSDAFISVDDHLVEPPNLWQDRLPRKWLEQAPQVVHQPEGDAWAFDGEIYPILGTETVAGLDQQDFDIRTTFERIRPESYDSVARLAHLDLDHVLAAICFPSFPGFSGTKFLRSTNRELGLLSVQAWNDFVVDEWCGNAPGRYIPMMLLPLWSPEDGVAEIHRMADKGTKAIAFSENPAAQDLPSIHSGYWDPVFAAAQEAELPMCLHIGSSSYIPKIAPDQPRLAWHASSFFNATRACLDWMTSAVFEKFPGLKVVYSEGGIGWMPHLIQQIDIIWEKHHIWTKHPLPNPPSTYFKDHVYGCFIDDAFGAQNIELIGVENVMVETDYPHSDSNWPKSLEVLSAQLQHLSEESRQLVLRGNAERLFKFTPSAIGER